MSKKENKNIWWYFKRVFIGLIIVTLLCVIFSFEGTWGLNKTVGWAWDFTNLVWWVAIVFFIISIFAFVFFISFLIKLLMELYKEKNSRVK